MKLTKKKVSFDIDPKILSDVQSFCEANNRKVSDFYRAAVKEKIEREKQYITIFVPRFKGVIEKYTVNKDKYDIELFEATLDMKINVNAAMQGIITITKDSDLSEHLKSCAIDNKIYFFTKEKYI